MDEIIVVDTGSADDTAEIARGLGASVIRFDWSGDFAAARNRYLAAARCSWVLSLDSDEVMCPFAADQVREMLRDLPGTAFALTIKNYFVLGDASLPHAPSEYAGEVRSGVGCTLSRTVRLFPRRRGIAYRFPVHESLIPSLHEQRIPIRLCVSPSVDHTGNLAHPSELARKQALYEELGLQKIRRYPEYAPGYLELGRLYLFTGELGLAGHLLRECIRRSPACGKAHYFYVLAALWAGERDHAARHLRRALTYLPRDTDLLYLRGMLALEAGERNDAANDLAPALRRVSRLAATARPG